MDSLCAAVLVLYGLLAVALVVAVAIVDRRDGAARRRARMWQWLADRTGCSLAPTDSFGMLERASFLAFRRGCRGRITNVMHGSYRGRLIRCFDYHYSESAGGGPDTTYHETLVMVEAPMAVARTLIRPKCSGDHLATLVGLDDIGFESEEFSRRYYVHCEDKRFAYGILHPRAIAYLLSRDPLVIEAAAGAILMHRPTTGLLPIPSGVRVLLDTACDFLDLVPEYLMQERASRAR
jgi:hypothetical protein